MAEPELEGKDPLSLVTLYLYVSGAFTKHA